MKLYYQNDLSPIKLDLHRILSRTRDQLVEVPREERVKEIAQIFAKAIANAKEHKALGSKYSTDEVNDEGRIMLEFEKYSEIYEEIVKKANE
jgi:hypothetical protein